MFRQYTRSNTSPPGTVTQILRTNWRIEVLAQELGWRIGEFVREEARDWLGVFFIVPNDQKGTAPYEESGLLG